MAISSAIATALVINAAIVLMIVATLSGCGNNNVKNDKANEQNAEKITIQLNSSQSANSVAGQSAVRITHQIGQIKNTKLAINIRNRRSYNKRIIAT